MVTTDLVDASFKCNIKLLKISGLYPYDSCSKICKIYAYISYILFTIPLPILASIGLIVMNEKDISKISDNAFLIVQLGALIVKLLPFKNNPQAIKRTIYTLNNKIFNDYLSEQKYIVEDAAEVCRRNFMVFLALCLGSLFSWPLKVLLYEERKFPIDIWLPFEPFEDVKIYLIVFFYLFLAVTNGSISNAALDTLIAGLIYHAAVQLRILKDGFKYLGRRVEERVSKESKVICFTTEREELKARITYKRICECIEHYDAIYKFVKDLEATYSPVMFTQFFASILVICISCLQLSIVEPLTVTFFAMVIYVITMLMEIFLYCYYGTILYEESNTVVNSIYMSDWYNFDQKSKDALKILMERAKRPMVMTAEKLLDLSLNTFTMIIRRSYSLLAVLKNY